MIGCHPPLFCALRNESPETVDILTVLIAAAPQTVSMKCYWQDYRTIHRDLPFHLYLQCSSNHKQTLNISRILLQAYPDVINIPNFYAQLPIQLAAEYAPTEVLELVYKANPACLSATARASDKVRIVYSAASGGQLSNLHFIHSIAPEIFSSEEYEGHHWQELF